MEWISAREAFEQASFSLRDEWKAMRYLRNLAKNGQIKTRGVVDGKLVSLHPYFWGHWDTDNGDADSYDDWQSGRFIGRLVTADEFNGLHASEILGVSRMQFSKREIERQFPDASKRCRRQRGRPPMNFWPQVAEELAVAVHQGVPDGPDTLISKVLEGMSMRGVDPIPERATIQSAVGNAFDRITGS